MKTLGYLLLAVGFLGGSFVSVLTEDNRVDWRWFVPALVVGIAGVTLARIGLHRETRHEGQLTANIDILHTSLDRIVANAERLDADKEKMHPYEVHGRIDELFPADLTAFVDAREAIAHVYGLQAYAQVMNEFAAGERYLNRVWSASVDGYIDDVVEYIGRAHDQFGHAQAALRALGEPAV